MGTGAVLEGVTVGAMGAALASEGCMGAVGLEVMVLGAEMAVVMGGEG